MKDKQNEIDKKAISVTVQEDGSLLSKDGQQIDLNSALQNYDIYITDSKSSKISSLSTGVVINKYRKTSWDYLREVKDFKELSEGDIYKQIDVCDKLYRFELWLVQLLIFW
jgi:hypothetical protein